ncbi:MAG: peptidylprolyl isomerase [Planctomycetota bacterium]|nr:peptidylprolyl isomerase [Planctomycetota bacterium]
MRSILLVLSLIPFLGAAAWADEGPSLAARAAVLDAEMQRRSADLVGFLQPDGDAELRRLAIRALGRIGNDGNAPGMLRDLLATSAGWSRQDAHALLWAAGIARSEELADALSAHLARHAAEGGDAELAAQAARSLGWTGADTVATTLVVYLDHPSAAVRAGALEGLARAGSADPAHLAAAAALTRDADAAVRLSADHACWLLAARLRTESTKADESWDGDPELAATFLAQLTEAEPERRMGAIRVLGALLPGVIAKDGRFGAVLGLLDDADPRVVQDAIWRLFTRRSGHDVTAALAKAAAHPDPKARTLAIEALGKHGLPAGIEALDARRKSETDARVREVVAIELVRNGRDEVAAELLQRTDRPDDPVVRQGTEAQLLLVSRRPEALAELMQWADPGASQRAGLYAATWMTVLGGLEGKEHEALDTWLLGFLAGGYAVDKPDRHHVMAQAVSLAGTNKRHGLAQTMLDMLARTNAPLPHDEIRQNVLHDEVRKALMEALAALAGDEGCPGEVGAAIRAALERHWQKDPSPWVRQAARDAGRTLGLEDVPETDDIGQPNTWRGLPLDLPTDAGDGELVVQRRWLGGAEILLLADMLQASNARVEFETTAGTFTVTLDAADAPCHAVSLFLSASRGLYADTRFHRVVPNFVIQGGDPRGHGAGDGGWSVPDEITTRRYVRGALGMPKSVKDDGGCQIFVMHTAYRPLDERYTCYGEVVGGMDVVDRIRVGDHILRTRVVLGTPR